MDLFNIHSRRQFDEMALECFRFQYHNLPVYRDFANMLGKQPEKQTSPSDIPFLPVEFFRNHKIIQKGKMEEIVFTSSGTTASTGSRHYVADAGLYTRSFVEAFRYFYGEPSAYCILALLPSYLEREGSSLVYMVRHLIAMSGKPESGFFLHDHKALLTRIEKLKKAGQKVLLLGVSFALLDFAEKFSTDLSGVIVMETGGMKGKRKEITREELHEILCKRLNVKEIHSEYGMTELLSQAYSKGGGRFHCPPWMKIMVRDPYDPFGYLPENSTGALNIIDLANRHSCSFIATSDLGKVFSDGSFEVLGRMDHADIRGCNLLLA